MGPTAALSPLCKAAQLLDGARDVGAQAVAIEALTSLGDAYLARSRPVSADDVELAIASYTEALRLVYKRPLNDGAKPADVRLDFLFVRNHDRIRARLAIAYDRRVLGSHEENLSQVLEHSDSLEIDDEGDTELRVAARLARGRAYRDRSVGSGLGPMDIGIALSLFREASRWLEGREGSDLWADAQTEIGATLLRAGGAQQAVAGENAADCLHRAMTAYTRNGSLRKTTRVHVLLGDYYGEHCADTDGEDVLDKAIDHYLQALTFMRMDEDRAGWARIQVSVARLALGFPTGGIDVAIERLEAAVDTLTGPERAADRREALAFLGHLLLRERRWDEALERFEDALALARSSVGQARSVAGRRAAAAGFRPEGSLAGLASGLAYCYFQLGRLDEALTTLESGKAQLLTDALRWTEGAGLSGDTGVTAGERAELTRLTSQIRELEAAQYGGIHDSQDTRRLGVLRGQLASLVERIPRVQPAREPEHLTVAAMSPAEPGTALVVPLLSPTGGAVFIVAHGDEHVAPENVLAFPSLTNAAVLQWLAGEEAAPGWFSAYTERNDGLREWELWQDRVLDVCGELWEAVAGKLRDRLRELGTSSIVVIPTAGLQFLPIHAAAPRDTAAPWCLLDDLTVSYIPSAYALALAARRRDRPAARGPALVAGVSRYDSLPPLPNVPEELDMVAATLGSSPLLDGRATRTELLRRMPAAPIVHLACHGADWALTGARFRMAWTPPPVLRLQESGLSFEDILRQDLRSVRLVSLSACDTGMVDLSLSWDEAEGLINVFLQAGAAAVVSSLWAVEDRSTALLMQRFYDNLTGHDADPAAALRDAQLWLRDSTRASLAAVYEARIEQGQTQFLPAYTNLMLGGPPDERPFSHPCYWAPFILTGA
ncbi:CHAT domain-containing protein [Frankia sp. CcI49]|uniref:CHAT domain-containing protein n=1 Tax=Frankia sp. CcI49 TaxID=1745382 RepID=UPI001304574D|nr:CHAT domain-containing protein [Frankia sp. CcI49]